ncbi:hypothetical protein ABBQ38_011632 [Trebouxia sp. C0009 RCD-2024]
MLFGGRARQLRDYGFFDIASTRLLQFNVPDSPRICIYYRVGKTYSATAPQHFTGAMTLVKHQEFRFYEQEPSGVPVEIGIFRSAQQSHPGLPDARQSAEPMAVGTYTVQGDEHGKPIAVKLYDGSGNVAAEIVFLLSCAPGWGVCEASSHSKGADGYKPLNSK